MAGMMILKKGFEDDEDDKTVLGLSESVPDFRTFRSFILGLLARLDTKDVPRHRHLPSWQEIC